MTLLESLLDRVRAALVTAHGRAQAATLMRGLEGKKLDRKLRREIERALQRTDPQHAKAVVSALEDELRGRTHESFVSDFYGQEVPWSTDDH